MKITILTPTFNRAYILPKLYESLLKQTENNFDWLIVDDGSTDDTKIIVKHWINEKKISIIYRYQKNGGKHKALNNGISLIKNDFTFIVDSDDALTEDAVETINSYYEKYKDYKNLCGFSFLRKFPNGKINGQAFKKNEYYSDYISCRINENITGDKAEIYKTEVLKKYPFLEVEGENFLSEDYVWIQIAEEYNMIHINKAIYVGDYLPDGLTKNIIIKKLNNSVGNYKRAKILCSKKCNLKNRTKGIMLYISYGLYSKEKVSTLFHQIEFKLLFIAFLVPAICYYIKLLYISKKQGEKNESFSDY